MRRRGWLWVAFVFVHAFVAVMGYQLPHAPMGDVYLVYEPWSGCALGMLEYCDASGWQVVGITESWVYPILALVPMIAAWAFEGLVSYTPAWAILVGIVDAVAFAVLIGDARSRGRVTAGVFWLAFMVALGPVGIYRLEGITVPVAILGVLWLIGRPRWGSALLAVATWIKVWPAALLAAALVAVRRRRAVIGGAALVSVGTILVVVVLGGAPYLFGFVSDQAERGLQIEAPVSAVYLWLSSWGIADAQVYYSSSMLTFEATGPGVDGVIAVMTPLLAIVAIAVTLLAVWALRRGAHFVSLFPAFAFALVMVLIVVNKVGSPQYMTWMIAPLVFGLVIDRHRWMAPAALAMIVAVLTQIVYPIFYNFLMTAHPPWGVVAVLTARNVLLLALLVWALVRLVRVALAASTLDRALAPDTERITR
ncbi:hypothetical protein GCM10009808_03180 [Microbacterium sediminicola]|uniref:DUF2029 domain-containing protein n=1 Tax=Microbacterium sediminicola TaxID=415210 RepID=A0ABN2HKR9_9MICO